MDEERKEGDEEREVREVVKGSHETSPEQREDKRRRE